MARKQRNLAKTAVALAATTLVEKAIRAAAEDPRVRRKAKAVRKALKKRAKAAGKKISKLVRKRKVTRKKISKVSRKRKVS
jgi:hypothetical protein